MNANENYYPKQLLEAVEPYRRALVDHEVYSAINSIEHVRTFMETHVFAVWDFMCLLKALQRVVTCVETPWVPRGDPETRRLINEIVLGEESDQTPGRLCCSHFELYLMAMSEAGANTQPIRTFIEKLNAGHLVQVALEQSRAPKGAAEFVLNTMDIVHTGKPHCVAAAFALGREEVIPAMFKEIMAKVRLEGRMDLDSFDFYLERHIQLDGDEHSILASKMLANLCGDHTTRWKEAIEIAISSLQSRYLLWDSVLRIFARAGSLTASLTTTNTSTSPIE